MGTLVCPLCCDNKFPNQLLLREHLLGVVKNVQCPECNEKFETILQLAYHLDGMCGNAIVGIKDEEMSESNSEIEDKEMVIQEERIPIKSTKSSENIFCDVENVWLEEHPQSAESLTPIFVNTEVDNKNSTFFEDLGHEDSQEVTVKSEIDIKDSEISETVDVQRKNLEETKDQTSYLQQSEGSVHEEIKQAAGRVSSESLPPKSRRQYDISYNRFIEWCNRKNVGCKYNENVLLKYFEEKSKSWKSSTLWANYSMIKLSLSVRNNVDISQYVKLLLFLKEKAQGYQPKKSKLLTWEQINDFITTAPDEKFLMLKVAVIMGVFGGCCREELCQMTLDDIQDLGSALTVKIPNARGKVPRTFTIVGKYLDCYRKYVALRPAEIRHRRLFIRYAGHKCFVQPVGINTFGKMPSEIANFLNLPDSVHYGGDCFRRTSASLFTDASVDLTTVK